MKPYAEARAQFHLSTEEKFENGDFYDAGQTERRHVRAVGVKLVGKEVNKVGDGGIVDPLEQNGTKALLESQLLLTSLQ